MQKLIMPFENEGLERNMKSVIHLHLYIFTSIYMYLYIYS